jgi:cytochrome c556
MKFKSVFGAAVAASVLAMASPVLAQDATAAMKERSSGMKMMNASLKALKASAEAGKAGAAEAAKAAAALAGAKKIATLFPAGTGSDKFKNRAKPEIWADKAKFDALAEKLVADLTAVEAAAKAGNGAAMAAAVKTVDATCTACHKPFRGAKPE